MATGLKRLGLSLAALVGALLLALGALWLVIDRTAMIRAVTAQVRVATGLDFQPGGETTVSLFPGGAVTMRLVTLTGDRSGEPAMTVGEVTASLRLLPLFAGRFEIANLTLINPEFEVVRGLDGTTNWDHIVSRIAQTVKPGPESAVSFSEIVIRDGRLNFHDRGNAITEELDDIDLSLAWPSIARSFAATGEVSFRGQRIETSIGLADFVAALAGKRSGIKVRLNGAPLKLAFDGVFERLPVLMMEGTLATDTPSLRDVFTWIGREPPSTGFRRFALKSRMNLVGSTLSLSTVNAELDGNSAEGVLSFSGDSRRTLQGTLAVETLDLSPYATSMRAIPGGGRDWSRVPFDLAALNSFDVDLRLSAANVIAGQTKFGRAAIAANLRSGTLTLGLGEAQAYGGIARGTFVIGSAQGKAISKAQLLFSGIDLEAFLNDAVGTRKMSGRGTVNVALEGSGSSPFALVQSLDGVISLEGRDGALAGINVEQLLRRLERRPLSVTGDFRSGRTPYRSAVINMRFDKGIASADDIRFAGDGLTMSLTGAASAPAREFDLKGVASLLNTDGSPSFELPFVVQGSWDNPIIMPDPEVLLRRSPASAPLFSNPGRARDAIKSAIERLSGSAPKPAD